MKFVVIGADAAGMSAASRAKRNQPEMEIMVLEKTMDVSYSAWGIPYNLAAPERDIEDLVVRPAQVFRDKQGINLLTGHCAKKIDLSKQTVSGVTLEADPFEFPYDRLLIATGSSAVLPDLAGFEAPGVMGVKNLEDGRKIKNFLKNNRIKKTIGIGI